MTSDRLYEGLEFNSGKEVVEKLLSRNLNKALQKDSIPEFYKDTDKNLLEKIFDDVILTIKKFSNADNKLSPVQPILLMLKKAKNFDELKEMALMKDTLIEFAKNSSTDFKKSEIYKRIKMEPFSKELWHDFEKVSQNYVDTSTHQATATKHTYETLYNDGEWKLFVPHSFEDDAYLAGGMEEFECINANGKKSTTTKAQWCTAASKIYYDGYTKYGNCLYVIKHYNLDKKCDEAYQIAFFSLGECIEIKDKYDEDKLDFLFDKSPKELLGLIKNDNPHSVIRNSLLDCIEMKENLGLGNKDMNAIVSSNHDAVEDYCKTGIYKYRNKEYFPTYVKKVLIPDSVTKIDRYAFHDCEALTTVIISNSVTSIDEYAFLGSGITSVTIPKSVTN